MQRKQNLQNNFKADFNGATNSLSPVKISLHENNLWNDSFVKVVNQTVLTEKTNMSREGQFLCMEPVIRVNNPLHASLTSPPDLTVSCVSAHHSKVKVKAFDLGMQLDDETVCQTASARL